LGNWVLQHLTHRGTVRKILRLGSAILGAGLLMCFVFPFAIGNSFVWLIPGLVIYFFGLGITAAPLNRFILFCTPISKGTTSALMSMIGMCAQALGIEIANHLYQSHNNSLFGFYCALVGFVYFIFLAGALFLTKTRET
jgi:DHA1 family multidrug/chloramphenicol efflux transport protein-like MFS transporter